VFCAAPAAIVSRLIRCVRSGPKWPLATVPARCDRLMQAVVSNIRCPWKPHQSRLPVGVAAESSDRSQRAAERRRAAASWRAAYRNTAHTVPNKLPPHGIDPHAVRMVGNQISLTREARDPEAVVRIRREEPDEGRRRVIVIANRHVQFIRSHDTQPRITVFHQNWCPTATTSIALSSRACFCTLAITRAVAMNKATTMRIGIIVHASSTWLLP